MLDVGLPCTHLLLRSGFNSLPSIKYKPFMSSQYPENPRSIADSQLIVESAIGQNLSANPECAKTCTMQTASLVSLGKQDHLFI